MCNAYDNNTYHHPIAPTKFVNKFCPKNEKRNFLLPQFKRDSSNLFNILREYSYAFKGILIT